ncbi:MAG: phosphoenolpyruvate--protein phosphotransferase [Deltaproteobacteria bacterium]|nr:phosphoenolpyruvate--protein phosphotransferase [Deltaproteobacteria bacterium]
MTERRGGIPASPGIALGPAHLVERRPLAVSRRPLEAGADAVEAEVERLREAIVRGREQVARVRDRVRDARHPPELAQMMEAHLQLLEDEALERATERAVREERVNAEWAVRQVAESIRAALEASGDEFFRERRDDVLFAADRIVRNLAGLQPDPAADLPAGAVVVAHELSPVDMSHLVHGAVAAVVTETGSRTSHTAILARALGLPAVVGVEDLVGSVAEGATVAVDGGRGEVVVAPPAGEMAAFRDRARRLGELQRALRDEGERPAETRDGCRIALWANIEFPDEVDSALGGGAEGIGLYRTEFLYVGRPQPPSEEEQLRVYERVASRMAPRPVTLRTFDLGGDKFATRPQVAGELNPALGLRALRLGLRERDVFRAQLRAMLRAAVSGNVAVMFPMVCGVGDFREALDVVAEAKDGLRHDGLPFREDLPVGCMLEVPSAVVVADLLARYAAFFSIGTNDLVQYALAIDRGNERVAHLYQPFHPAVLRLMRQAVRAGRDAGLPVSMCGAMAEDPLALPLLVGLDIDRISVAPASVPLVKAVVRSIHRDAARRLVDEALEARTAEEVAEIFHGHARRAYPDLVPERLS